MTIKNYNIEKIAETFMSLLDTLTFLAQKEFGQDIDNIDDIDFNLSSERIMVLYRLFTSPQQNLKELAQSLKLTSSSMSSMINNLVEEGLVVRKRNPDDRRKVNLSLTDKGEEIFKKTRELYLKKIKDWLKQIDEKEYNSLYESSKTVTKIVAESMPLKEIY